MCIDLYLVKDVYVVLIVMRLEVFFIVDMVRDFGSDGVVSLSGEKVDSFW